MAQLTFSHTNIAMATNESTGRTIVWDRDTDTFGSGFDYPSALKDLAENYGTEYHVSVSDEKISDEEIERVRQKFDGAFADAVNG